MNNKHAYIIMAHKDPWLLQQLIGSIDDIRNDILILIDKKSDINEFTNIHTVNSQLITPPLQNLCSDPINRIDCRWGDISQIKNEIMGFKTIVNSGKYSYIHLISGQDLPLKSQNFIHNFFNNLPKGTNLIGFAPFEASKTDIEFKTNYYHLFTSQYRARSRILRYFFKAIRVMTIKMQQAAHIKRKYSGIQFAKGPNWVSITDDFCRYIVENEEWILKTFKYVPCADEIYKQTLILNSPFRDTVYRPNADSKGCLREIDWNRGIPYIWRDIDYEHLCNSECIFARKFDSTIDRNIIAKIAKLINQVD